MKEAKSMIFSKGKIAPYVIEERDLDKIAKTILGAFKFSFNYWNRALTEKSEEQELAALKSALTKCLGHYNVKNQNLDSLKQELIESLLSFYLSHKAQNKILTADFNEIKQHVLILFNQSKGSELRYLPG